MTKVFVSHSSTDSDVIGALRTAFAAQGWETTSAGAVAASEAVRDSDLGGAIVAADVVIVLLPAVESSWVRREVQAAQESRKPLLVIEKPGSVAPGIRLWDQPTIRWDLKDTTPILRAVNMVLRTGSAVDGATTTPSSALSAAQASHWKKSIQMAEADRFERQVIMMLSDSGLDLTPPAEAGVDLVAWSDDTANPLGNPFGIEIERAWTPSVEEQAQSWLARSGVSSLLILVGEGFDVAVTSTDLGRLILVTPALELIDELGRTGFGGAIRTLAQRAGVHL